jgi:hypothetical protein
MTQYSAVLDEAFDPEVEEGTKFDMIPPGKYTAEIDDASVAPTKSGNGQAVKLKWRITEGDHEGRVLFQTILIQHTSAEAQKFGRMKFKDVAFACDINAPITDLSVLKYKPCTISVGIETDKTGEHSDRNKVQRVMPYVVSWNGLRGNDRQGAETPVAPEKKSEFNDAIGF